MPHSVKTNRIKTTPNVAKALKIMIKILRSIPEITKRDRIIVTKTRMSQNLLYRHQEKNRDTNRNDFLEVACLNAIYQTSLVAHVGQ